MRRGFGGQKGPLKIAATQLRKYKCPVINSMVFCLCCSWLCRKFKVIGPCIETSGVFICIQNIINAEKWEV